VPNYRINLLSPAAIENGDFAKFNTELGLVLGYIKNSRNKDALRELMKGDKRYSSVSAESVELINVVTDSGLEIGSREERVDMCQAIRDIRQEGVDEGMQQGMVKALGDLVRDGVLTLAEASARAGLTAKEFKARLAEL
jgi:hypothetical protein